MTEQEAIEKLKADNCVECGYSDNATRCDYGACGVAIATRMAIKALEEIQQYRAIGTVEECREAVEKQRAKKPKEMFLMIGTVKGGICPCCNKPVNNVRNCHYCNCGQRLDWIDGE